MSKTMLAAVKPRKWVPPGLKMKFITVAMIPTADAAPGFLIHQTVSTRTAKPIKSQKRGKPVILKNMGAKIELMTPHNADSKAIAATSRLLKYVISNTFSITNIKNCNT